jgi:flagellar hook-basal body complex protein FliE
MEHIQGSNLPHIKPVMPNSILPGGSGLNKIAGEESKSFSDMLSNSIQDINKLQQNANQQVEKLARGEIKDVHQVMVAAQEASLTFSMMMQIRNKIVEAYQEISKM